MRTIQIEFDIPEDYENDYADVCPELVFEDFFEPKGVHVGFRVVGETVS